MSRRVYPLRQYVYAFSASMIIAALVGCGGEGSTAGAVGAGTGAARATYAEHDHHVPEHKPESFPDAVASLRRRTAELQRLLDAGQPERTVATRITELRDILDWLPLLGADSDLTKMEWQPIRRAAANLERLYPHAVAASGPARERTFAKIGETLDGLAEIVAALPDAYEIVPHPDHDHHHHHQHHDHQHHE